MIHKKIKRTYNKSRWESIRSRYFSYLLLVLMIRYLIGRLLFIENGQLSSYLVLQEIVSYFPAI